MLFYFRNILHYIIEYTHIFLKINFISRSSLIFNIKILYSYCSYSVHILSLLNRKISTLKAIKRYFALNRARYILPIIVKELNTCYYGIFDVIWNVFANHHGNEGLDYYFNYSTYYTVRPRCIVARLGLRE